MNEQNNPKYTELEIERMIDRALGQSISDDQQLADDEFVTEMEYAAAHIDLAVAVVDPIDLPTGLSERIQAQARQYPDTSPRQSDSGNTLPFRAVSLSNPEGQSPASTRMIPWMVAAASMLIATISILMPRGTQPVQNLSRDRLALIADTPSESLTQWDWISTDDPAVVGEVYGDVVWSDTLNKGYMRISGLAVNDTAIEQYQLWIFDATRPTGDLPQFGEGLLSQRPVDGGVFDVSSSGEVIIEIHAKLKVEQAAAFAITVEPPGGVVVSDRSRVPLLALAP